MIGAEASGLGRLLSAGEAETAFGRALLNERYRLLQRQIPLVYLLALANVGGFHMAHRLSLATLIHPANWVVVLVLVRLGYWLRTRNRELPPEAILGELRRTLFFAALFSLAAIFWSITFLLRSPDDTQQELVILFASLAAVGVSYGMSGFPAAARMPLLLFALPFSAFLAFSPNPAHLGVGACLFLITLLTLRLIDLQDRGFVEIVRSRSAVENERERADLAKQEALAEKARVRQIADSDPLTGLANRRAFLDALGRRLADPAAPPFSVALLDLDGFKPVNDTFGHAAGDAVLVEVATRLRAHPEALVAARIGGDEFALILSADQAENALAAGQAVSEALSRPYRLDGREFRLSSCCGLVLLQPGECDEALALRRGDAALYSGKAQGKGCVALFTPELERVNARRVAIERALRSPEMHDQIGLVFQPIFDLGSGAVRAFEALARWQHPELGTIAPSEFIPITEQINVIESISAALLASAAEEAGRWPDSVRLSFNLSAVQLCSASSAGQILATIAGRRLDPERLQIEVTETALLADFETARLNLNALRHAGARVVLDDFGAGYASISYLREMFFDAIKLDGSLLVGAADSTAAMRLFKGVLDLCASLNVPCIAEHIETADQLALLRRLGCRDGQGFALAPPLAAAEARELAAARLVPFRGRRKAPNVG